MLRVHVVRTRSLAQSSTSTLTTKPSEEASSIALRHADMGCANTEPVAPKPHRVKRPIRRRPTYPPSKPAPCALHCFVWSVRTYVLHDNKPILRGFLAHLTQFYLSRRTGDFHTELALRRQGRSTSSPKLGKKPQPWVSRGRSTYCPPEKKLSRQS